MDATKACLNVVAVVGFFFLAGCGADEPPREKPSWSTMWTVDLVQRTGNKIGDLSDDVVATLRASRGALWFPPVQPIDYDNLYVKTSSVGMQWHFDSEEPYYAWAKQFLPEHVNPSYRPGYEVPDDTVLRFTVSIKPPDVDRGASALTVYYDANLKPSPPRPDPVDEGLVWGGRAHKYCLPFQGAMFKLLDSKLGEPTVINCGYKASYCQLRGGEYSNTLHFHSLSIPRDDLPNWRVYFEKAKKLLDQSLVYLEERSIQWNPSSSKAQ